MPTPPNFTEVAKSLSPVLLSHFQRQFGERATAEDLVQESLLRIQRGLPQFDGRSTVKTWALAIARRVAADYRRKGEGAPAAGLEEDALKLADPAPLADHVLARAQMNDCVREELAVLPPEDRRILALHDLEDAGIGAVAKECGCSDATARVRLHRARKRLGKILAEKCELYHEADNVLRCCRKEES